MSDVHHQLEDVFQSVFGEPALELRDDMTAADIDGWDSVAHINLMFAIEEQFGVRFAGNELAEFENIGALKQYLARRIGAKA